MFVCQCVSVLVLLKKLHRGGLQLIVNDCGLQS